jgi:transglutaminase-like putative cysteine protease
MHRREFFRVAAVASAATMTFPGRRALAWAAAGDGPWRTYELTTRVEVPNASGPVRVWVPVPLTVATGYQRPLGNTFTAEAGGTARLIDDKSRGFGFVSAAWPAGAAPRLSVVSRVQTRDVAVDLTNPRSHAAADKRFLRPSAYIPSDGIVRMTAEHVTRNAKTDVDKARAIYDWIVDNTFRDPTVRGCGIGDIKGMLETKNLGGKCADLNALYVGLAHASGLAARDVYGVRAAKSGLGYKSLGLSTDQASKAQHCRAEVFLSGFGWVPVDPADVRKVVLEEPPGHLAMDAEPVQRARQRLFGSWEMNWIAYNFEHDVALPGLSGKPLGYFMYPQGETAAGVLDSLDPDTFRYSITAREITSAS